MAMDLRQIIESTEHSSQKLTALTDQIHTTILNLFAYLDEPNFRAIHPTDSRHLFDQYDERFFAGQCPDQLSNTPLEFRLAKRMTQATGKACRITYCQPDGPTSKIEYEIAVFTTGLFQTFWRTTPQSLCQESNAAIVCKRFSESWSTKWSI